MSKTKTSFFTYTKQGKIRPCSEAENEEKRACCAVNQKLHDAILILCDLGAKDVAHAVRVEADSKTLVDKYGREKKAILPVGHRVHGEGMSWVEYCELRGINH